MSLPFMSLECDGKEDFVELRLYGMLSFAYQMHFIKRIALIQQNP
jgi:hypothetical protein